MEYKNLEEYFRTASEKFRIDLIKELDSKGHKRTGDLDSSIKFSFKKSSNSSFKIELECNYYIKYLEKGKLIKNFLKEKTKEIKKEIPKYIKKDILKELKK